MGKREVIVDTCFLEKMSTDGKNPENVKTILEELEYTPVAHPYMVEYEFSLCSYMQKMVAISSTIPLNIICHSY